MQPDKNQNTDAEPSSIASSGNKAGGTTPTGTASKPKRIGQFRISTLLSWTAVICFLMTVFRVDEFIASIDPTRVSTESDEILSMLTAFAIFILPPWICIPILIDQFLERENGLNFKLAWRIILVMFVAIFSVLMLMLATVAFSPDWKESKGPSWFYYTLDGWAGLTLWPIYGIGASLFASGITKPELAKRNPLILYGVLTCAAISFWYVLATLFMSFAHGEKLFATVPGGCGVCYAIYAGIIWRNAEFSASSLLQYWQTTVGWLVFLVASIIAKYPLATRIYDELPDEAPEGCFIVTAATRGHQSVVGTWFDEEQDRLLNQQLLVFWKFESQIKQRFPQAHVLIRWIYNRIGPIVARMIVFRWQADLVYWTLKPIELLAKFSQQISSGGNSK